MSDTNHDPFDDSDDSSEVGSEEYTEDTDTEEEESSEEESEDEEGEDDTAETPNAEDGKVEKTEKMIPESRLKAALKDVTEKLEKSNAELAKLTATPAPDRSADPDGYELHVRIETSKEIMRDTVPDYDEKIEYYQKMAAENPSLNTAVAAHRTPAKHAYDIAKKAMEIDELIKMKDSDEWKEFQAFRKSKVGKVPAGNANSALGNKLASKVPPNLNRGTNVGKGKAVADTSNDDLFSDAPLDRTYG